MVEEEARRIALHIVPLAAVADAALVVLGGGLGANGDLLLDPVRALLADWVPYPPRVEVSALGEAAVLTGALSVGVGRALDSVFDNRTRPPRAALAEAPSRDEARSLEREIREQPAALERFLAGGAPVAAIARALRGRELGYVMIAARGSSDNAARYAQYLFGERMGLPVALAAPSLETLYGAAAGPAPRRRAGHRHLAVGALAGRRRRRGRGAGAGAPTVAITNDGGSALAHAADFVLELDVGRERSVAATKTYTARSRRWRRSSPSCATTRRIATPCGASRRWRSARWTTPSPRSAPSTSTPGRRTSSPWAGATTTRRRWRSP